jgi:ABC-type antimicrobial peptide transport system permease subunit
MKKRNIHGVAYFAKNLGIIVGIVLVWRGVWYILDEIDKVFFNDAHLWTAIVGIVVGFLILYLPDRDLKEIEKL